MQCVLEWPRPPFSAANISSQSSLLWNNWGGGLVFANGTSQFSDRTKILNKVLCTLLCPMNIVRARKATQYDFWKHSTDVLWKSWDTSRTPSSSNGILLLPKVSFLVVYLSFLVNIMSIKNNNSTSDVFHEYFGELIKGRPLTRSAGIVGILSKPAGTPPPYYNLRLKGNALVW